MVITERAIEMCIFSCGLCCVSYSKDMYEKLHVWSCLL
jgi:hypothetical protein